jgi:hypothetical protein
LRSPCSASPRSPRRSPRRSPCLAALAAPLAAPVAAQEQMIGFEKIQQLLAGGQARLAARELQLASVAFRSEIGRCRDEEIGARLVELEPRFTSLAERVQTGAITTAALEQEFVAMDRLLAENPEIGARLVELEPRFTSLAERVQTGAITTAALEQEFVAMDRLLAENHLKLAVTGWGLRRFGRLEAVATDLRLAALYLDRSANWSRQPLPADLRQAVDGALAAAEALAKSPANPPGPTGAAIEAFDKAMKLPR